MPEYVQTVSEIVSWEDVLYPLPSLDAEPNSRGVLAEPAPGRSGRVTIIADMSFLAGKLLGTAQLPNTETGSGHLSNRNEVAKWKMLLTRDLYDRVLNKRWDQCAQSDQASFLQVLETNIRDTLKTPLGISFRRVRPGTAETRSGAPLRWVLIAPSGLVLILERRMERNALQLVSVYFRNEAASQPCLHSTRWRAAWKHVERYNECVMNERQGESKRLYRLDNLVSREKEIKDAGSTDAKEVHFDWVYWNSKTWCFRDGCWKARAFADLHCNGKMGRDSVRGHQRRKEEFRERSHTG